MLRRRFAVSLALAVVLFAIAPLPGCATSPQGERTAATGEGREIVVLTYNIRHGRGMDDEVDLDRIADVIRDSGADVVALQEVDNRTQRTEGVDQAAALAELLEMEHVFGRAIDHQGGEYGNAILSRFPIEQTDNRALAQVEEGEERAAIAARVRLDDGRGFTFISTHLDHASAKNRLSQIVTINRYFGSGDEPAVLAGDINNVPDTEELQRLAERWRRACEADAGPTSPSDDPRRRIDYIFVRPAERWQMIDATVIDEPLASDHRPVRAVIRLD